MSYLIEDYWVNQNDLPSTVQSELDYLSRQYGYGNGEEMLRDILISMQREMQ